jgi:hypothetical protein
MKAIVAGFALLLLAVPAQAQTADARWESWLGCWELTADNVREAAPAADRAPAGTPTLQRRGAVLPRVCVTRDGPGARFETTVSGQAALDHTIIADATDHPLTDADCRGTQRAEWSRDGLRFFSRADLTCTDDQAPRVVSGLSMLAADGTWLDIQAIAIGSRDTVRVRRYYRAAGEPAVSRATIAAAVLSLDDVKEASGKVAARALEAALVETSAGFDLKGRTVLDLDQAGVPDSVIDLIVALSYPQRFVVERRSGGGGGGTTTFINDPFMVGWAFGYPRFYDDYYYSPYYYTPFGYRGSFGAYGDDFVGVAVAGAAPGPQPSGAGRVVDGQGYTRIRPRESAAADNGPSTVTRTNSASSSAPASSGSSSSGSTVSSAGYSSGGSSSSSSSSSSGGDSGGDTGRTAQPR